MLLETSDLTASYGNLKILHGISFTVGPEEIVSLFGPNGHGKSTLLKTVAGLHPVHSGQVVFKGERITSTAIDRIVKAGLVYIPEDRLLFPEMTVEENLKLGAYIPKAHRNIRENLSFVYEIFPRLYERRKQGCASLSGGESRMVAVGRGLMSDADCIMVDEPSIGLSPLMKETVFEALESINRQKKIALVIVEQEIPYPLAIAQKVYILKRGTIMWERSAQQVNVQEIEDAYF